ncbi:MAG: 50S ribosomal protein L11 methyltransferase [Chthoniobacteraceae bacterium]
MSFVWRKLSPAKWDDVWPERLAEFVDRLAITALAGSKTSRLEVFALDRRDATRLAKEFGGTVSKQTRDWLKAPAAPRAPINVRGRLYIVTSEAERPVGKAALIVPAGMAFGTGEHATTLNCLRFVADFAAAQTARWELLDVGCGSGILALAARALGATKVEAGDFDPDCVRTAKQNVRLNKLRGVAVRKMDVFDWKPARTWPAITANLYSTILIQIAPKLARALAPGGTLIFSGVMRDQEREVVAAFRKAGLRIGDIKRQGKWIAGTAHR